MTHGVASTKGHVAGNGGLRGHSVGDVFPFVLYMQGTFDYLEHWILQPNGLRIGPFKTYDKAHGLATRLKMFGQLSKDDPATPDIIERETTPQFAYYRDVADDLFSQWRWRVPSNAEADSRAEYSSNKGRTWTSSGYTVGEIRTKDDFVSIGDRPLWYEPSIQS